MEFCLRVPRWNVLVALIGTGQAIHVGEEAGLKLWREAVERVRDKASWAIHVAPQYRSFFDGSSVPIEVADALNLDQALRFHLTADIDKYVGELVDQGDPISLRQLADALWRGGHRFLLTQDLEAARSYLRERYEGSPKARYGLLASSKDRFLVRFGIDNHFNATKQLRVGPWYNAGPGDRRSCCQLTAVATEFSSQGLELDCALLAWGSDLRRESGSWSDRLSGGYRARVKDRLGLRRNVYRVLMTRGRDGTVIYVPRAPEMAETYAWLLDCGMRPLEE